MAWCPDTVIGYAFCLCQRMFCPEKRLMRCLVLAILIALSAQARADECEQLPPPSVVIKRFDEGVALNKQYGYKTLTTLGAKLARPGNQVLGLTRGNAVVQFSMSAQSVIDRTGRWECFSPQLTLSYGFSPMTVFVANEFPEGSCAYKKIYEHELRHVKAYQEHMVGIEKALQETLNRRFATGGPWRGPVGQKRALLQQELDERWARYVEREIARVEVAQALIDTPEEYARVANSCDGEIKRRIQ